MAWCSSEQALKKPAPLLEAVQPGKCSILHQLIKTAAKLAIVIQIVHHTNVSSLLLGPGQVHSAWVTQCSAYMSSPGTHQGRGQ